MEYIEKHGYKVAQVLHNFVNDEILPQTGLQADKFWQEFIDLLRDFCPKNEALLAERANLQAKIDEWHKSNAGNSIDPKAYFEFLHSIGYIEKDEGDFTIETENVDDEIAKIAGPQLVVPILNARFALNAANARWGSLYDGLYGTDVISDENGAEKTSAYNNVRGKKVISWVRDFLNETAPLENASWHEVHGFKIADEKLVIELESGKTKLQNQNLFIGFCGTAQSPSNILLKQNSLHIDIVIDKENIIGKTDIAGIADVILESALTCIMDNEDSIAAVDAADKVAAYRNWLGLIKGTLSENFEKNGKTITRTLNGPRQYVANNGGEIILKSQTLMLHRNVGLLMKNNAILNENGEEVFEGILDAVITAIIGVHDVGNAHINGSGKNSQAGSIYIVKPKMHGPKEVAFAVSTFERAEKIAGLANKTMKIGIMDEERRMSVNLKQAIRAARQRVVFINTGFLDRTGDEIFTSMHAGIMIRKADMKQSNWIGAYEDRNVDIGLACGFAGKAQIGKGMWAAPDKMSDMLAQKIGHPQSGANTAWVPSPTAATLHATHYHKVDVFAEQKKIKNRQQAKLESILSIPLANKPNWDDDTIQQELDNNAQGILGYVVRWINQGVGCSKVPDINNIGLMEDRATLRISSQHMANWLQHGLVDEARIISTMKKMAKIVDKQNEGDSVYENMSPNFESSIAFQAALDLVLKATKQPSGYTEPLLHFHRLQKKKK